jgi:hypothetical protein
VATDIHLDQHHSGDYTNASSNYQGDDPNATSKLNSTSQTEVSTEREYSPGGIFSPKI